MTVYNYLLYFIFYILYSFHWYQSKTCLLPTLALLSYSKMGCQASSSSVELPVGDFICCICGTEYQCEYTVITVTAVGNGDKIHTPTCSTCGRHP